MHFSIKFSFLSIFSILSLTITCLLNTPSHPSKNHNAAPILERPNEIDRVGGSVIPYNRSPGTPNPTINSLSIRSADTTNTSIQGRRSHIAYGDFSFLIWSDAHTHLLKTMAAEFRTAAISVAKDFAHGFKLGAEYGTITFAYGAFILVIYYVDKIYLLEAILEVFTFVLEAMYPVTYTLVWAGMVCFVCYIEGHFDGKRKWKGVPGVGWPAS